MEKSERKKLLDELINCIFDDHEGGIEAVDMMYKPFIKKLKQLADLDD